MVAVSFSGEVIAVYEVIAEPPFFAGAVNATEIEVEEILVAVPIVGAPGQVCHWAYKVAVQFAASATDA